MSYVVSWCSRSNHQYVSHTKGGQHLRWVHNLHIAVLVLALDLLGRGVDMGVVVAELQETLDTSTGVLRTLAIEAVRQAHD